MKEIIIGFGLIVGLSTLTLWTLDTLRDRPKKTKAEDLRYGTQFFAE